VNAKLAIEQVIGTKDVVRKDKVTALGRRMMRAEGRSERVVACLL